MTKHSAELGVDLDPRPVAKAVAPEEKKERTKTKQKNAVVER